MRIKNWLLLSSLVLLNNTPQAFADNTPPETGGGEQVYDQSGYVDHSQNADMQNNGPSDRQNGSPNDDTQYANQNDDAQNAGENDGGKYVDESQSEADRGDYPHITELENAILGKTYNGEVIEDRLNRLEIKAFGAASKNPDLSARTDALDNYAENKLHKKTRPQDDSFVSYDETPGTALGSSPGPGGPQSSTEQNFSQRGENESTAGGANNFRKYGTMVGTGLLNIAGMGLPGFGGVRVRNRADLPPDAPELQQQKPAPPPDDPAVFEKTPPPSDAKLLTKVGWCEVQIFGRTVPSLHLTKRLQQLNDELHFAPGKTGVALMDASDAMIRATQSRVK